MTIPIIPGPFSFIPSIGKGIERYAAQQDLETRRALQDNINNYMRVVGMVNEGHLPRSVLGSEQMAQLATSIGMDAGFFEEITPQPEVGRAKVEAEEVGRVGAQPPGAPARRQMAGVPQASEVAAEQARMKAIEAGGPAGRAVTGVPAEPVAAAAELAPITDYMASQATMIAGAAVSSVGGALTASNWETARANGKRMAENVIREQFGEETLNQLGGVVDIYVDGMLMDVYLKQRQVELSGVRAGVQNRYYNLQLLDKQIDNFTNQINALEAPSESDQTFYRLAVQKIQTAMGQGMAEAEAVESLDAFSRAAYDKVKAYLERYNQLDSQRGAATAQLQRELELANMTPDEWRLIKGGEMVVPGAGPNVAPGGPTVPTPGPSIQDTVAEHLQPPPAAQPLTQMQIEDSARILRNGRGTEQQLDEMVAAGRMRQEDVDKIKNRAREIGWQRSP